MMHEQHLALDLIARLADRFGPASRIAKELPSWLEYLTDIECPERPRSRPSAQWWEKVRSIAHDLVPSAGGGEAETVQRNAALFGDHFGLSRVETSALAFVALYKLFDGFEHVVDGALDDLGNEQVDDGCNEHGPIAQNDLPPIGPQVCQ